MIYDSSKKEDCCAVAVELFCVAFAFIVSGFLIKELLDKLLILF